MEFKQDTIGDILTSEHEMVLHGAEKYGKFFINADETNGLLSAFLKSIELDHYFFAIFLSQVKKHLLLAQFSAVRLHHVQTGMNIRQALEAGSWAAFAIANVEKEKFYSEDREKFITYPQKLKDAKNKWLQKNFPDGNDPIKRQIKNIGDTTAHANIVYAYNNFELGEKSFKIPFFDFEDDFRIKTDLWQIANVGYGLMDLFYGINKKFNATKFSDDFLVRIRKLKKDNDDLKKEMMESPRYKKYKIDITSPNTGLPVRKSIKL